MHYSKTLALVATGAAALLAACNRGDQNAAARKPTAIPVVVAASFTGTVPVTIAANGTVEPLQTVEVQPQVAGPITAVRFNEGDEVRAGQVLFEIDPRPAQAALAQAQAVLARDRATASAAQADAQRYGRLVTQGYVTQSQAGQQAATAQASQATLASDQAQVEAARLNLNYTTIRAPISGKTGTLNVRLGNQVRVPNTVPLVSINAVAPVLVRFPVPDRTLQQVRQAQRAGRKLEVTISGAPVGGATERGVVDFIDNAVDTVSGSVTLKARFANADRRLWPGAFLPLTLSLGDTPNAVLVPNVAVQQGPQGPYVFVPDGRGKAKQVTLTVGRTTPIYTVVSAGLAAGDTVVVDGQSRLFPGAAMKVARAIDARQTAQIAALGGGPGFGGDGSTVGAANGQGGGPGSGTAGGLNGTPVGGATGMTNGATNAQASANTAANAGGNGGARGANTPGAAPAGAAGAGASSGAGVGGSGTSAGGTSGTE